MSFQELKEKTKSWFKSKLGAYKWFCTFQYRDDINRKVEDARKDIRNFRQRLSRKLFGRGDFNLDFLPVVETRAWNKDKHCYQTCRTHIHILVGELPAGSRELNEPFDELLKNTWCELNTSAIKKYQDVRPVDNTKEKDGDVAYTIKNIHGRNQEYDSFDWFDIESFSRRKN